jgi:fatty-acyl-CoA synthase
MALKAWVRALERTAKLGSDPHATLPRLIEQLADRYESAPALVSEHDVLSYRALSERANRYARWAISQGIAPGATVCLLLTNCPDYLAIWLGLTRAGLSVALLNTHLAGESLAHAIRSVAPAALIAGGGLLERIGAVRELIDPDISCWAHRIGGPDLPRIDQAVADLSAAPLDAAERAMPSLSDRALYIYTSGTTGLPKAAIVTHLRVMRWAQWFSGMMNITPADRMYDCLPLYHSVGGVVATGATLVGGGSIVLRERFSASRFWEEVTEHGCTVFQYIGELCRFLLAAPPNSAERAHRLRLACGNGLQREVWTAFQSRFRIPRILEYYASTEGNVSLYNCEGRRGSVGRVPPFLAHRYPVAVIRTDAELGKPLRDPAGRCIPCAPGEPGELLGQISGEGSRMGVPFEGYTDAEATREKVLKGVFAPGDAWYRTGDLMTRDEQGFFYFVDRLGDTFRWRGENVSTTEVTAILLSCRGVTDAAVYGVAVPGVEGRAPMAALAVDDTFDLAEFRQAAAERLPAYARPLFLRIVPSLDRTGTFKLQKHSLLVDGFDPGRFPDPLYFDQVQAGRYVTLDAQLHARLIAGRERL